MKEEGDCKNKTKISRFQMQRIKIYWGEYWIWTSEPLNQVDSYCEKELQGK